MLIKGLAKKYAPVPLKRFYNRYLKKASRVRRESNAWLRQHAADITGRVLSIGSDDDADREGGRYRDYFKNASSYLTSEVAGEFGSDMVLDVRDMSQIKNGAFDCIFCSGVLEHVDDYVKALKEVTRILSPGGVLLLGFPFRQAVHMKPHDYWRFTEHGIRYLLNKNYEVLDITSMDNLIPDFPSAYWAKARKL